MAGGACVLAFLLPQAKTPEKTRSARRGSSTGWSPRRESWARCFRRRATSRPTQAMPPSLPPFRIWAELAGCLLAVVWRAAVPRLLQLLWGEGVLLVPNRESGPDQDHFRCGAWCAGTLVGDHGWCGG